ncbi:ankyrin repeat domain-containing protein [Rickettsiales bacterium]|nr:ankyrin repeat domain-containing protein [Rickettsiales bacterium]|tara:strand:+ start:35 stop:1012 length:978 start_codon:yes stop_codon:yes gene_type:complete
MPNKDDETGLSLLHKLAEYAVLSREESIFDAIKSNDTDRVEKVLQKNDDAIHDIYNPYKDGKSGKPNQYGGQTPLLFAIQQGNITMVDFICSKLINKYTEHKVSLIDACDNGGVTPIIDACEKNSKEFFEIIIKNNCDPNKARMKDGYRALEVAICNKDVFSNEDLGKLVQAGAEIKDKSQLSRVTPLQVAIIANNINALDFLLSKLCLDNPKLDRDHSLSLLKTVIECNNSEAATLLRPRLSIDNLRKAEAKQINNLKKNKAQNEIRDEVQQLIQIFIPNQESLTGVKRSIDEVEVVNVTRDSSIEGQHILMAILVPRYNVKDL